jgi:UDP-N-acetylmuramate-alanine ligase
VDYCADWHAVPALLPGIDDGDVVLTLGAGDIYRLAEALVKGESG